MQPFAPRVFAIPLKRLGHKRCWNELRPLPPRCFPSHAKVVNRQPGRFERWRSEQLSARARTEAWRYCLADDSKARRAPSRSSCQGGGAVDKIPRTTVVREPSGLVLTPDGTPRSPKAWLTNKNGWASGVTTLLI